VKERTDDKDFIARQFLKKGEEYENNYVTFSFGFLFGVHWL
jgi:hypothetical protein